MLELPMAHLVQRRCPQHIHLFGDRAQLRRAEAAVDARLVDEAAAVRLDPDEGVAVGDEALQAAPTVARLHSGGPGFERDLVHCVASTKSAPCSASRTRRASASASHSRSVARPLAMSASMLRSRLEWYAVRRAASLARRAARSLPM